LLSEIHVRTFAYEVRSTNSQKSFAAIPWLVVAELTFSDAAMVEVEVDTVEEQTLRWMVMSLSISWKLRSMRSPHH